MTPNYSTWRTRAIPIAGNFTGIITDSKSRWLKRQRTNCESRTRVKFDFVTPPPWV
jgi:hypothetical protein